MWFSSIWNWRTDQAPLLLQYSRYLEDNNKISLFVGISGIQVENYQILCKDVVFKYLELVIEVLEKVIGPLVFRVFQVLGIQVSRFCFAGIEGIWKWKVLLRYFIFLEFQVFLLDSSRILHQAVFEVQLNKKQSSLSFTWYYKYLSGETLGDVYLRRYFKYLKLRKTWPFSYCRYGILVFEVIEKKIKPYFAQYFRYLVLEKVGDGLSASILGICKR